MTPQLVLVVDDEPAIHRFLKPSLTAEGYRVLQAMNGAEALTLAAEKQPDIVVLDLGLPDIDGKVVIQRLRQVSSVPIIVLSARDREVEKIRSLDLGADDFVNKPFSVGELMARLRAALRHRTRPAQQSVFSTGAITIDIDAHTVLKRNEEIKLTRREFDLLAMLFRHAGKVVTHRHLLHEIWGPANERDTQYLRVYVGQLRAKLEDDPSSPRLIVTEPGIGYRLL